MTHGHALLVHTTDTEFFLCVLGWIYVYKSKALGDDFKQYEVY
jgi:hypothetical protein